MIVFLACKLNTAYIYQLQHAHQNQSAQLVQVLMPGFLNTEVLVLSVRFLLPREAANVDANNWHTHLKMVRK
jgi:hypothetical protein